MLSEFLMDNFKLYVVLDFKAPDFINNIDPSTDVLTKLLFTELLG